MLIEDTAPIPRTRAPLRLGDAVPDFVARSTVGPMSLSRARGRWLVLFSHPGDFTPVCTSEFVAIARAKPYFDAMDCGLMALSVDSLFSHLAWIRLIRDRFDVDVDFPIVEDPTLEIARGYGMIGPGAQDASSVRATLFIDPDGVLRASTYYPATVGRSVKEMLRIVAALQRVQDGTVLAPAEWRPGEDLLAMPDHSLNGVMTAATPSDWFYRVTPDRERE